jgi:hypothetical protein
MANLSANGDGATSGAIDRSGPASRVLTAAVGMTLLAGFAVISGLAHLNGVITTAGPVGYAYDFRFAGMLIVGVLLVVAGTTCLAAVGGLARRERAAWERALYGTLVLLLVTVPLIPVQPGNAGWLAVVGAVNLVLLRVTRRRGEVGQP